MALELLKAMVGERRENLGMRRDTWGSGMRSR
jgi:hypothetical protein